MRIGLCMLVRDEADRLTDAVNAALPVIDHLTIIDTGSTDGTDELAQMLLDPLPGIFARAEWQGFAHNRTQLLQLAQGRADYHLMLDADHTLHIDGDQPELSADSYLLRVRGEMEWRLPLLTRDGHPFEYRGSAHAYLVSDIPTRTEKTDWLSIDGGAGASRQKLERDLQTLLDAFRDNPADTRTIFYLAQTYRDLNMPLQAIGFYLMRANMGGFPEEVYWARHQAGCLLSEHVSFVDGSEELLKAWRSRPSRMESLRALAHVADAIGDKTPVPDDLLFVRPAAYAAST